MFAASGIWPALVGKLAEHWAAAVWTGVLLTLYLALKALLPRSERQNLRAGVVTFALYLGSVPVRALLSLYPAYSGIHDGITLGANLCLAFSVIGLSSALLFDVVGRSLQRMRILRDVLSTIAGIVVLFVLLSRAHVNILSIVTTSAVITAVIGLAFQDTLGNILSGVAMQLESTLSLGDWITVGDLTGQVLEIRWRSTAIVTRNDDLVVIPNSTLAKATIVNLSKPVGWHRQWIYFGVHYRHPPNEVQRIVLDSLRDIANVKPADPGPDCILYKMEADHAVYAVRYRLLDLRHDDRTNSDVYKRIWYSLRRHGIEIPYPARNVFVTELNKEREQGKWEKERARRLESLARVDVFAPLQPAQRDLLVEKLAVEVYGAGERVLDEGAPGDSLYLVRRGEAAVRATVGGVEREVALLGEGQFFGEMSLMTGEVRRATVIARTDVECYVIDRALFQQVLAADDRLVKDVSRILAERQKSLAEVAAMGEEPHVSSQHQDALATRIRRFFGLG